MSRFGRKTTFVFAVTVTTKNAGSHMDEPAEDQEVLTARVVEAALEIVSALPWVLEVDVELKETED
jgi:hypothetical protein